MFTRRELAKIVAGASALTSVTVARPRPQTADRISQAEIAALLGLETEKHRIALAFRRRLAAGATFETGQYELRPSAETLDDLEMDATDCAAFNCPGFDRVGYARS